MGRAYAVAGGKGGVGKTTTVVNLGVMLRVAGHRVAVLDADLGMANVATVLGIEHQPTLHDVLAGEATVDEALVEEPEGFGVVPGGATLDGFAAADPERLEDVIETLQAQYDYVLVDTGAGLSFESVLPIGMTDGVLLVTTPERAAVEDTAKTAEIVSLAGGTVLGAVLTRARESEQTSAITDKLNTELLGVIPEDPAVQASIDAQKPLITLDADSPAATAYRDLGQVLLDRTDHEEDPAPAGGTESTDDSSIGDSTTPDISEPQAPNDDRDDAASVPDESSLPSDTREDADERLEDRASEAMDPDPVHDSSEPETGGSGTEPDEAEQVLGETADPLDELIEPEETGSDNSGSVSEETEGSGESPMVQESASPDDGKDAETPSDLAEGSIGTGEDRSDPIDDFLNDADSSAASDATESETASTAPDGDTEIESSDEYRRADDEPGDDTDLSDETPDHAASAVEVDGIDEVVDATADADAVAQEIEAGLDEESPEDEGTAALSLGDEGSDGALSDDATADGDEANDNGDELSLDQSIGDNTASESSADLPSESDSSNEDDDGNDVDRATRHVEGDGPDSNDETAEDEANRPDHGEDDSHDESDADEESSENEDEPEGGISIPEAPSDDEAESAEDDENEDDDEGGRGFLSRILHPFG